MTRGRGSKEKGQQLTLAEALAFALELHKGGHFDEAEALYREVLEAEPEQPDALHYLGVLSHQTGDGEAAVTLIERAIARLPDHADMHNNLGNVLSELGRLDEAAAAYRKVIALRPDDPDAYGNFGVVLKEQGKLDEAAEIYRKALALMPDSVQALQNLGNVLRRQGKYHEAAAACRRAIEVLPGDSKSYLVLGSVYYAAGRLDEAAAVYQKWLDRDPDNALARHMLAASTGRDVPERASDQVVRQMFEGFAGSFERVLDKLEYRAPALITACLAAELGAPAGGLDVLDAGCGTGLCGPLLAPYTRRLTGVDLSPAMLAKAKGRGVYDALEAAELTAFLEGQAGAYDLIASADTLCYFGALEAVLAAAARALRPGGRLVFTLENAGQDEDAGFRLGPHGRYSHTKDYVRRSLAGAGLALRSLEDDVLRKEGGKAVAGLVVLAQRPG
ncbi:MAG: tetratricopeptide repeat protein [Rhodospirillales bacterium]|nr:tetratricopeptide repeat protein [Rhodospirillales bacterium]